MPLSPRPALLVVSALSLLACATSPAPTPAPEPGPEPVRLEPAPDPTPEPVELEPSPPSRVDGEVPAAEQVLAAARGWLADRLGIDPQRLTVEKLEQVVWSDLALGCPAPDRVYGQMLTPGFRILLAGEDGRWSVHSDREGRRFVECRDGRPVTRD